MNKKGQIKSKLKVLQGNGIKAVILDVIKYITEESGESATDEEYARGVDKIYNILKRRYEDILNQQPEQKVRNRDLEDLIKAIKEGRE